MSNSAEQLHHGKLNPDPSPGNERLFIDLDVCSSGECEECVIKCSYWYHPWNNGIISVAELATYALVCRLCEEPHCVSACPKDALEHRPHGQDGKILVRHSMRCISCKSCSHACPYGTIYPELLPQLANVCDFCEGRRDQEEEPLCIKTCPYGALKLVEVTEEPGQDVFLVGDNLLVHSTHWDREKA